MNQNDEENRLLEEQEQIPVQNYQKDSQADDTSMLLPIIHNDYDNPEIEEVKKNQSLKSKSPRSPTLSETDEINKLLDEQESQRMRVIEMIDEEFSKAYKEEHLQMVFVLVFFSSLIVNIDHGSLPACSEEVKQKMGIENFGFGSLGTLVYFGLTVGSIFGTKVYSNTKYIKYVLTTSLVCLGLVLVLFTISQNYKINIFLRFLTGFFEVFVSIYAPVWADAFATEKLKSIWISGLLLCSPLGIFVGFTLTSYMVANYRWEYSFLIQAAIAVPCVAGILYTPLQYLNIDAAIQHRAECAERIQRNQRKKITFVKQLTLRHTYSIPDPQATSLLFKNRSSQHDTEDLGTTYDNLDMIVQFSRANSLSRTSEIPPRMTGGATTPPQRLTPRDPPLVTELNLPYIPEETEQDPFEVEEKSILSIVAEFYANKIFILFLLSVSGFFYVVAGVLYWCPNYLDQVLLVDKKLAASFFAVVSFTAPVSGVLIGGLITSLYGGYNTRKAKQLMLNIGLFEACIVLPLPFISDIAIFILLIWLLLFFGGFILPSLTGIMLNTVPESQRGSANSVAMFAYNLLGYMPSPAVYGFISMLVENSHSPVKSRLPMAAILYSVPVTAAMTHWAMRKLEEKDIEELNAKQEEDQQGEPQQSGAG